MLWWCANVCRAHPDVHQTWSQTLLIGSAVVVLPLETQPGGVGGVKTPRLHNNVSHGPTSGQHEVATKSLQVVRCECSLWWRFGTFQM